MATSVNRKIEQALNGLVDGNIWPLTTPKEQDPEEYITYNPEDESAEDYGDDQDTSWIYYMQVHYVKQGQPNTLRIRKQIRKALRRAGFTVTSIDEASEDGKLTHLIFSCYIEEEDSGDEEV